MFHVQTYIYFPVSENPSFPAEIPVDDTAILRKAEPYSDFERFDGRIELSYQWQPILTEECHSILHENRIGGNEFA